MTEDERRLVVTALLERREYGSAFEEILFAKTGLGRVGGYELLAGLERQDLVERNPYEGVGDIQRPDARRTVPPGLPAA